MILNAYASSSHYAEHIDAVWSHLPPDLAGVRYSASGRAWPGWQPAGRGRPPLNEPVLVAGYSDVIVMAPRPYVYLEHGAGQSYPGGDGRRARDGSYAGGDGHDRAVLFLCPSETVADRWRARYPATPAVAVGCPKLDPWTGRSAASFQVEKPETPQVNGGRGLTVAVTFHADIPLVPETRTAWPHYDDALPDLAAHLKSIGGRLLGHGHPRLWGAIERRWRRLGVECVPRFADVLDRADLLVADTTSALYEFASTGRPVLTLNAPWYRRDVEHGLRFWSHIPGLAIDHPANLIEAVQIAAADPPPIAAIRRAAVAHAYAHVDGSAGKRAATAVEEALRDAEPVPSPPARRT